VAISATCQQRMIDWQAAAAVICDAMFDPASGRRANSMGGLMISAWRNFVAASL